MGKLTLEELRALRERAQQTIARRQSAEGATGEIVVGMGTCGIAAGAREALDAFIEALNRHQRGDVVVRQTGCMGLCYSEPTVEVRIAGMPPTIYGRVTAEVARRIVEEHILAGRLVDDHVYDRPAPDIAPHLRSSGK
ncbi:MAG: (2Fe-2S) ferredoxin domain-containing protein [Kiritimatiellae bacterium]|nr:(2Fe-2S) ferredoxin domain-containing protein [Kiritimatiellia bacterium]